MNVSQKTACLDNVGLLSDTRFTRRLMYKIKGLLVSLNPGLFWKLEKTVTGKYLENEISLLSVLCQKNKTSIDIGANYGAYLSYMLPYSKNCIGFEPNSYLAKVLSNAFKSKDVKILNYALSDRFGTASLRVPIYHLGYSSIEPRNHFSGKIRYENDVETQAVPMAQLDDFGFKEVGLIKIDVEGHEFEVLRGARKTLTRERPYLIVEIEERHRKGAVGAIIDYLIELEYDCFFLREKKLIPFFKFRLEVNQNPDNKNDYVRNFIFIPHEKTLILPC